MPTKRKEWYPLWRATVIIVAASAGVALLIWVLGVHIPQIVFGG